MKKGILASILIGFGVAVLLFLGNPLGPVLFAFGLLGVCYLDAWLFTGKAGYYWKNKITELYNGNECIKRINKDSLKLFFNKKLRQEIYL